MLVPIPSRVLIFIVGKNATVLIEFCTLTSITLLLNKLNFYCLCYGLIDLMFSYTQCDSFFM